MQIWSEFRTFWNLISPHSVSNSFPLPHASKGRVCFHFLQLVISNVFFWTREKEQFSFCSGRSEEIMFPALAPGPLPAPTAHPRCQAAQPGAVILLLWETLEPKIDSSFVKEKEPEPSNPSPPSSVPDSPTCLEAVFVLQLLSRVPNFTHSCVDL